MRIVPLWLPVSAGGGLPDYYFWGFDGNLQEAGGDPNFTYTNSGTTTYIAPAPGQTGNAASLSNGSLLNTPSGGLPLEFPFQIETGKPWGISFWFKHDTNSFIETRLQIRRLGSSSPLLEFRFSRLSATLAVANPPLASQTLTNNHATTYSSGQWRFYYAIKDTADNWELGVNNEVVTQTFTNSYYAFLPTDQAFLRIDDGFTDNFDSLAIWTIEQTNADMQGYYNGGAGAPYPPL